MRKLWYTSKWAVLAFHVLTWVLVLILPALAPHHNHEQKVDWEQSVFNRANIGFFCLLVVTFYFNAYYLIPTYLYKARRWTYFTLVILTFLGFCIACFFMFDPDRSHPLAAFHWRMLSPFIPFIFLWMISTLFRMAADKVKTDKLLKEKENENLKTELSFLRSQVSPHFLFNVLNNMVAMARLKSDKLEPSLIKLSGLMRYMLYESDEEKVPLAKEIEYVNSYIDLQRLRFGSEMKICVNTSTSSDSYLIEPMLLIPFIENAFKHGVGMIHQPEIDISLDLKESLLDFNVKNRFNGESNEIKDKTSGIGLANVTRRLDLLYPKRHMLDIQKQDGWFSVSLQIKLQP